MTCKKFFPFILDLMCVVVDVSLNQGCKWLSKKFSFCVQQPCRENFFYNDLDKNCYMFVLKIITYSTGPLPSPGGGGSGGTPVFLVLYMWLNKCFVLWFGTQGARNFYILDLGGQRRKKVGTWKSLTNTSTLYVIKLFTSTCKKLSPLLQCLRFCCWYYMFLRRLAKNCHLLLMIFCVMCCYSC